MVKLLWEQLRYDIEQQTYNISQMRMSDRIEGDDKKNYDGIVSDESLADMIMRYCETGTAKLYALLADRLVTENAAQSTDTLEYNKTEWAYTFKEASETSERALAMLMHKFVVAWALGEWAGQFAPDSQASFFSEAEDVLADIEGEAFSLATPVKKRRIRRRDIETVSVRYEQV